MYENELASCRLKIERAKEHFAILGAELLAWANTKSMRIVKETNDTGSVHRVFVEVIEQAPLNRWSLIAGDCVHNLRSALDSLVYGIAIYQTTQNPPPDEKVLQFPIVTKQDKFSSQEYRIKSLSPSVQAEIEKLQPYHRPHPQLPPLLGLLSDLNNQDKHKTLNVVAAAPHSASIDNLVLSRGSEVTSITAHRTIITDKTEIMSFTLEPSVLNLQYTCVVELPICIVHSPGPSKSPLSELAGVLTFLIGEVETVVDQLTAVM
jgi:hypothetical protein